MTGFVEPEASGAVGPSPVGAPDEVAAGDEGVVTASSVAADDGGAEVGELGAGAGLDAETCCPEQPERATAAAQAATRADRLAAGRDVRAVELGMRIPLLWLRFP